MLMGRFQPMGNVGWRQAVLGGVGMLAIAAGCMAPARAATPPASPQATATAIQTLLDSATYWRTLAPARAIDALNRLKAIDPGNADGLAMLATVSIDQNDPNGARAAINALRAAHPDDPRLPELMQRLNVGPIDPQALAEARRLANAGDKAGSVAAYQKLFKGSAPPREYAAEYYLTLAGVPGQLEAAQTGMARYVMQTPQDLQLQLAYAKLLTFGEATRPDGIDRLEALSKQPAISTPARVAWRDALLWQGADLHAQAQLETYLAQNPSDAQLDAKRADYKGSLPDAGTQSRMKAYEELEAKHIPDADRDFQAALAFNPNDADAMIMLAVIRKQQGRLAESKQLTDKAIAIAPDRKDDFLTAVGANAPASAGYAGNGDNGAGARAVRQAYARVTALTNRGEFAAAEAELRKLMGRRGAPGALVQLGYIQLQAGRLQAAEATFRQAVTASPRSAAALSGLASVLAREGHNDEAAALYAKVGNAAGVRAIGQIRAAQLRDQAHNATDPVERIGLLRAAVNADPSSPWLKLELARQLWAQKENAEARQVMAGVGTGPHPGSDAVQAGLIWSQERNDLQRANQLIAEVPAKDRTPQMVELQQRAQVTAEIDRASAGGGPLAQDRLIEVAANPDPTGMRGAAVAAALIRLRDKAAVRTALRAGLSATSPPTSQQRLQYASALSQAGFDDDARAVLRGVDPRALSPLNRTTYQGLANGLAVQQADRLNQVGKRADAYDVLAPRLQADPQAANLNLAVSRLYQSDGRTRDALRIDETVLQQNPDDLDVRRAVVDSALQAGETGRASRLAAEATTANPDDPRTYLMQADIARSRGNNGEALAALRKARALRQEELARDTTQ